MGAGGSVRTVPAGRVLAPSNPLWPFLNLTAGLLLEPTICNFGCKGTPAGGLRDHGLFRTMEVSMTMHSDHHTTDAEGAAFDATMKAVGVVIVLIAIAGMGFWYSYAW